MADSKVGTWLVTDASVILPETKATTPKGVVATIKGRFTFTGADGTSKVQKQKQMRITLATRKRAGFALDVSRLDSDREVTITFPIERTGRKRSVGSNAKQVTAALAAI